MDWSKAVPPVDFESRFLVNACAAFVRRRKAIQHLGGELWWWRNGAGEQEWIQLVYEPLGTAPRVSVVLDADNRATVSFLGNRRGQYEQTLAECEGLLLIDTGDEIVKAFERSLSIRCPYEPDGKSDPGGELRREWAPVMLKSA